MNRRQERRLAREVTRDAAREMGMRRVQFMRRVSDGDITCKEELAMSLASHPDAEEIDIEKFGQILDMIIEFIRKLMDMFAPFLA